MCYITLFKMDNQGRFISMYDKIHYKLKKKKPQSKKKKKMDNQQESTV